MYDKCEKKLHILIEENSICTNRDESNKKYRDLVDIFTKKQKKLYKITVTPKVKDGRVKMLETYITDLKTSKNKLIYFDGGLFCALVDKVIVNKDKIIVKWRDGTEG